MKHSISLYIGWESVTQNLEMLLYVWITCAKIKSVISNVTGWFLYVAV